MKKLILFDDNQSSKYLNENKIADKNVQCKHFPFSSKTKKKHRA